MLARLEEFLDGTGLFYRRDSPFAGTYVPERFAGDPRVMSVMIEVNRGLYLDEQSGEKRASFGEITGFISRMVETLVEATASTKVITALRASNVSATSSPRRRLSSRGDCPSAR